MREIKFRAWNKKKKEMDGVWRLQFVTDNLTCAYLPSLEHRPQEIGKDIELMQYTGFKDKNDVEMYEGDIIKGVSPYVYLGSGEETGEICTQTYQIIYLDEEARFGAKTIKSQFPKNHIGLFAIKQKDMSKYNEVIGNIYENRELLKDKN